MNFNNNTILVIPGEIKNKIIKNIRSNNKLLNIKFMTLDEFRNNYYFSYDNKTIYYLMSKYGYKYDVALVYLKNIYYIKDNVIYNNDKINILVNIKKELIDNKLLYFNDLFRKYVIDKDIVVYGFDSLNMIDREMFTSLNANIIYNSNGNYNHSDIYEFNSIEEEINYVCINIINLINKGININNIKLLNVCNDYYNIITRIFNFYNIPINIDNKVCLYSTEMGLYFSNNINCDISVTLKMIRDKFDLKNEYNLDRYNKIISIVNEYTWCNDFTCIRDMIIHDLKNTYKKNMILDNCVEIVDYNDNLFDDDNYYFMINFNQGSIPICYKDEEYITDDIRNNTLTDSVSNRNKIEKDNAIKLFSRIKNLIITYKIHDSSGEVNISNIQDELKLNIINNFKDDYEYSNIYNKLRLSIKLDDMIKYNIKDKDISYLYNNYKDIKYLEYNNKFTGLGSNKLLKYLDNGLLLSYSTIDNFNRCGFRYYLSNILKISIYEDTFMTVVGSLFHHILELVFKNNDEIDIDYEYDKYLIDLDREFDIKEKFFLNKLKNEIKFIINSIKLQLEECNLDKILCEEKIYIDKSNNRNIKITFMGVIDKIMYKDYGDKTITSIIDYKTGNPKIDLNTSIYGIEMQLPIYLYLASNSNKISNIRFAGFYLQKILNNEIVKDFIHSYDDLKRNNLKLQGYSNEDISILSEFDKNYMDSRVIRSMKTTNKGFYSYSKVINDEKMNKLIDIVDKGIDDSIDKILDAKFDINPKKIGNINYGCEFCDFKDICFMKNNDIVNLKEYKKMEFLESVEEG